MTALPRSGTPQPGGEVVAAARLDLGKGEEETRENCGENCG
jgi:hypothetical protein